MAAGSHFGCPKITLYRISYHFRSIPQFVFWWKKITKWLPAAIWMSENHFRSHFWPFQINTIFFFNFYKMAAGAHFGCAKFTFDRISGHFRSTQNFFCLIFYGSHFESPKFTLDHISGHFRSIQIFFFFNFWQNGCRWQYERSLNPSKVIALTTKLWDAAAAALLMKT